MGIGYDRVYIKDAEQKRESPNRSHRRATRNTFSPFTPCPGFQARHVENQYHEADPASSYAVGVIPSESERFSPNSWVLLFFISCQTATPTQLIQTKAATTPYAISPPVVSSASRKPKPPSMMASVRTTRPHHTCKVDQIDLRCSRA